MSDGNQHCTPVGDMHERWLDDGYTLRHPAEGCTIAELPIETDIQLKDIAVGDLIVVDNKVARVTHRNRRPSWDRDESEKTVTLWYVTIPDNIGTATSGLDGSRCYRVREPAQNVTA